MTNLVEQIWGDGRIQHVRDQCFFAWRFQNPLSMYRFLFWEDTYLQGYLVLQASVYADREQISIVDWEATDPEVCADLLETALRYGKLNNVSILSATVSKKVKQILSKASLVFWTP